MLTSSARGRSERATTTMEETLQRAKTYMQSSDYSRAIVLLQRARNLCRCIRFSDKHEIKNHSSAKACLRDSLLSAALSDDVDDEAVYKAATGPCSCGVPKLACDDAVHMDVLDKLAACSAAMGKSEAAIGFAAAAIHLDPKSPVGYCRLSKLVRTRTLDEATLRSSIDNEVIALGLVRHGLANVKNYGDVQHPLYQVLRVISKKLYRRDPLRVFPPELKVMILSYLDTLTLVRCQRACKRWLFTIRDDPNLWTRLTFIFTGRYKLDRITKGMLKVINRSKRASTLSLAPAAFTNKQYQLIFSHLKDLRHLHMDAGEPVGNEPCAELPRRLTRLTFFMPRTTGCGNLLKALLKASAPTLEELHAFADFEAVIAECLPRLKILRMSMGYANARNTVDLERLGPQTPNLEQLCIDGDSTVHDRGQGNPLPRWPKLKVLVLGWETKLYPFSKQLIPPGIQVVDILSDFIGLEMYPDIESANWAELKFFRSGWPWHEPDKLSHVLGPSLGNGNLEVLSLAVSEEEQLDQLPPGSQHVQALGLAFDTLSAPFVTPRYLDWVAKFPNAHTFTLDGREAVVAPAAASLVLRPGTRRIFEDSLRGVVRDQLLQEAVRRDVDVVRCKEFPVVFPWRLDGDGEGLRGQGDVVDQWKDPRGRLIEDSLRVSNQPFFRE